MVALPQPENTAQKVTRKGDPCPRLITVLEPVSAASEAYRTLRTSLLHALDNASRVIAVTGAGSAEGNSAVCANLGVVLAQAGKNMLLADCDFRHPAMHEMFGLEGSPGIVDALSGKYRYEYLYRQPLADLNLKVLTVGARPSNPAELLSSPRLSAFFASVRGEFDIVLVNAPPTGAISDPLILATYADGVLLTLDARKNRKQDLQRAIHDLEVVGANVLGTVVNNAQVNRSGYF